MGQIYNPPATTPPASLPVVTMNQFPWGMIWQKPGTGVGGLVGTGMLFDSYPSGNGTQIEPSMSAATLGTLRRAEFTCTGSNFSGWEANLTGQLDRAHLQISSTAGFGGFYCELYGGIGENYNVSGNPGFFLGLASYSASATGPPPWLGGNQADFMGIGVPGGAGSQNWATVVQVGTGTAATVTPLSPTLPAAAQQFFALSFLNVAGSIAVTMNVKKFTAPGTWATLVSNLTFNSRSGIGLTPAIIAQTNAVGVNGVFLHRCYWQADTTLAPRAFS